MRMLHPPQLKKMVIEFLKAERPETYHRLKLSGELEEVAEMRAQAATEQYESLTAEMSPEDSKEMARMAKESPMGNSQFMTRRENQIVESVLAQMLDFPADETAQETT